MKRRRGRKRNTRRTTSQRPTRALQSQVFGVRGPSPRRSGFGHAGGPFYTLNPDFEFLSELRALILKPASDEREHMIRDIARLGRIKLAVAAGVFMNTRDVRNESALTDLFIVGDEIDRRRVNVFLRNLEANIGKEIKLGVMDLDEFEYRYTMFDRFVRTLLEGPHEKLINKLGI